MSKFLAVVLSCAHPDICCYTYKHAIRHYFEYLARVCKFYTGPSTWSSAPEEITSLM